MREFAEQQCATLLTVTVDVDECVWLLRDRGIELAPALSSAQLVELEWKLGISFGSDHAALLRLAVPVGPHWPDWRGDEDALRASLARPDEGLLYDVGNNAFWVEAWGPRPAMTSAAVETARSQLAAWPRQVPIYSHRYMTAGSAPDAPVFSIHQSDVIMFGVDLLDYVHQEFGSRKTLSGWPTDDYLDTPDPWLELASA